MVNYFQCPVAIVRIVCRAAEFRLSCNMNACTSIRWRYFTRILALLGVCVMISGRFVHIHQVECSGHGAESSHKSDHGHSGHSCCHHHHGDAPSDEVTLAPEHNHEDCEVCSYLAITPLTLSIVEVPQTPEYASDYVLMRSASAVPGAIDVSRSRGPPAV